MVVEGNRAVDFVRPCRMGTRVSPEGAWVPRSQGVALSRDCAWLAAAATRWPFPFNLLVLRSSVWIDRGCGLCRYCHDVPPPSSVKLADLRMVRA